MYMYVGCALIHSLINDSKKYTSVTLKSLFLQEQILQEEYHTLPYYRNTILVLLYRNELSPTVHFLYYHNNIISCRTILHS